MKSIARINPVKGKVHIYWLGGMWFAKCPSIYGSLRGVGRTPLDAYQGLLASLEGVVIRAGK